MTHYSNIEEENCHFHPILYLIALYDYNIRQLSTPEEQRLKFFNQPIQTRLPKCCLRPMEQHKKEDRLPECHLDPKRIESQIEDKQSYNSHVKNVLKMKQFELQNLTQFAYKHLLTTKLPKIKENNKKEEISVAVQQHTWQKTYKKAVSVSIKTFTTASPSASIQKQYYPQVFRPKPVTPNILMKTNLLSRPPPIQLQCNAPQCSITNSNYEQLHRQAKLEMFKQNLAQLKYPFPYNAIQMYLNDFNYFDLTDSNKIGFNFYQPNNWGNYYYTSSYTEPIFHSANQY